MQSANVMLPIELPSQKSLRDAVHSIILSVQHKAKLTDEELADKLGISIGTVRNARDKKSDLNAATIARIGAHFGAEELDPYAALYGARNVPIEASDVDALPSMSGAVHRLVLAQTPSSPGGTAMVHTELLEMLPLLREAQAAINALICRAEKVAA